MPSFLSRLLGAGQRRPAPAAPDTKASRAGSVLAMQSMGLARWTPRNYVALTQAGYERNAVVYRAVRMIAEAAASVPWLLFEERAEIRAHPLLDLLQKPNPADVGPSLMEALFTNLLLFGNAYVEATLVDGVPRELYALRPDRMSIVPGPNGWPIGYDYMIGGNKVRYALDSQGVNPILHLKLFHPLDDHYGFSPLAAAQVPLDIHNAAGF